MELGQSDDIGSAVAVCQSGSEAEHGSVEGAAKWRRYYQGDMVVVGKGFVEDGTLFFTEGSQERVWYDVVFRAQVVKTLDDDNISLGFE